MPDLHTLILFAAASTALAVTPGPDMVLIASRSLGHGRRAGFATLMGVLSGVCCHALAVALGLAQLFLVVPAAYDAVRFAGAAYLLVLAWQAIRSETSALAPVPGGQAMPHGRMFRQGLITNLLNPKVALFIIALFPQFVRPEAGPVALQVLVLAAVFNAIGFVVNAAVIVLAGRLRYLMARWARLPNLLLGTVFAGLACRLVLDDRP
ncbi:LysE family translocator [Marinivivus vitaminiproducens]|uniref:LysE family translocator n=1 Tax=Marinivivus vitaminiproducens TaxID=3035935 RepID=UPI00279C4718|nr:LysE family translocator [Geminicoccaceae bacterium SCSIO 64248]